MKHQLGLIALIITVLLPTMASATTELQMKDRQAVQDARLLETFMRADRLQRLTHKALGFQATTNDERDCGNAGAGSAACWKACTDEHYSSSTCAPRCGVSTSPGAAACWNACIGEHYGSSTCAGRCGIETQAGSRACWNACTAEHYGSSTCAERCGTN